jgi:N-acetylglucosaminyldiphosphoundecaprenol N-acetyl-beta-D-mannosaminyltransferase
LFGLDMVDGDGLDAVVDAVLTMPPRHDESTFPMLVTPNVDIVVNLDRSPDSVQAEVFRRAQYVLPDGMPIVASSRLLRAPLSARLTGSGLFEKLWPRLAAARLPVTVVCADAEIAARLQAEFPEAVYVVPPYFDPASVAERERVIDLVAANVDFGRTRFVLFGLGHPKDAILADGLWQRRPAPECSGPLCLGLGGSFAMHTGLKKRAPRLVQRLGLEWFYRFCQEPRRLFRRYFVRDLAFFAILGRELRANWALGRPRRRPR